MEFRNGVNFGFKLVEIREGVFHGSPQIKLTFVLADAEAEKNYSKLVLFLTPEEWRLAQDQHLGQMRAGATVFVTLGG